MFSVILGSTNFSSGLAIGYNSDSNRVRMLRLRFLSTFTMSSCRGVFLTSSSRAMVKPGQLAFAKLMYVRLMLYRVVVVR